MNERILRGAVIVLALASPWSISGAEVALGVGTIAWAIGAARGRWPLWNSALALPLTVFALVWIGTAVRAAGFRDGLGEAAHQWSWIAAPVVAAACADRLTLRRACLALLVSESLLGAYCSIQHATGRDMLLGRTLESIGAGFMATGTFSHHLTLAGHAALATCVAGAGLATARSVRVRLSFACAALGCASALVWSFGRSAWIGCAAAAVVMCAALPVRVRRIVAPAGVLAAGAALLAPAIRTRVMGVLADDVIGPRWRLWQTSVRIIRDHPLWGIGAGQWDAAFARSHVPGHYWATAHPHNDWLNVWVCSGAIGFAAFVWVWAAFVRLHVRARRAHAGAAVAGVTACAAILVAGLFQCYQTDAEVAILLWGLVGATAAAVESRS